MATRKKPAREKKRYWLSFDLGLRGNYDSLYEWLDRQEAQECGDSIATFRSDRTRDQIAKELAEILRGTKNARAYLINLKEGAGLCWEREKYPLGKDSPRFPRITAATATKHEDDSRRRWISHRRVRSAR